MPRLSLYKPEKGNDYKFIDKTISEMFVIGGTELYIHKYLGPKNPEEGTADQPVYDSVKETNIQDLLFLENRDRVYDSSIYRIRGVYNVQDIDFNLSQFGLFIDNDTVYMTVHINDYIRTVGRKPLSGDVIEVPHLKDEFALNEFDVALPRYFVISDVGRAAEGFSPTWYPHLYRLKLTKIVNSQQYADIFNKPIVDPVTGQETDQTLADILSTKNIAEQINDAMLAQAEADAPYSGYETRHFYTLAIDDQGNVALETVDATDVDVSIDGDNYLSSTVYSNPVRPGYAGYLLGDGITENGAAFGHGITFPNGPIEGDYFLRTDFLPNRLFRYDGSRWVKREDAVRTSMTPSATRNNQKGTFVNNRNRVGIDLIASDIVPVMGNTIETDIDFTPEIYVSLSQENVPYIAAPEITNVDGKVVINVPPEFLNESNIDYKVYRTSTEERQALSKALRPKRPLADL